MVLMKERDFERYQSHGLCSISGSDRSCKFHASLSLLSFSLQCMS